MAKVERINFKLINMKIIGLLAFILVIVGALNWGLVGVLDIDLVALIFGEMTMAARAVYALVGIAGVVKLAMFAMKSGCCGEK